MMRPLKMTRRRAVSLTAGVATSAFIRGFSSARADQLAEAHGMSAFGDLAYPADFAHFRYVDPSAPKGGTFSQVGPDRAYNQNFLTFNSLNSFILKGDAAQGMDLTFATLMVHSGDEPDAMYGLAAAKVRHSADGLTYQFLIRPQAKFHDGTPLTAHDVAFSLNILKAKGHPIISQSLRDFIGAEAEDDRTVTASFAPKRARDVPLFVAGLPIFSRAYYATKPFEESTLDIPLGSGAYQVGRFEPGRYIEYNLVKDLPPAPICSTKSSPRASGRRATIFRRSKTAASRKTCCPTIRRPARKAGSSICDGRNFPIRACARRSTMLSISNGPTRTLCTAPMSAPSRCFRIPR
jgi:microcin C transport system substrate-binding protein